jgi:hypothetical protein
MARKFLTALDLGKNELQNARIQNLATDPSSPVLGQIYFNTVANEMRIYNGTVFEAIGLNGVTADAAEINILDGATLTTTELNYVDGVTSGIQGQLDLKAPLANPTFTGTVTLDTGVNIVFEGTTANAFETTLTAGDPTDDRTVTLPDRTTTLVGTDTTDTLTNKTLTSPTVSGLYLSDATIVFEGTTANDFETTLVVTDPTSDRVITFPDLTGTVVLRDTVETLTNKTLTSPAVSGLTLTDGTIVVEGSTNDDFETTISFVDPTADQTLYVPNASGTLARVENKLHDFALATSSVDLNSQKITNLAAPTSAGDAANKAYVDEVAQGLIAKPAVDVATTGNVTATYDNGVAGVGATLTVAATATLNIDGKTSWVQYDSVLFKNQTNKEENGRYVLTTVGGESTAWVFTRCGLCDTANEIPGAYIFVTDGATNHTTGWVLTVDDPNTFVVGTDDIDVYQFSGAGTYVGGNGLTLDGNVFNVGAGAGIVVNTDDVAIDTAVVVRKYAANIGDGSATSYTITHNLGTRDVTVGLYEPAASYAEVVADVEHSTTNTITVKFTLAPTTDQFRVVVHG